jgi:hypothetical protein
MSPISGTRCCGHLVSDPVKAVVSGGLKSAPAAGDEDYGLDETPALRILATAGAGAPARVSHPVQSSSPALALIIGAGLAATIPITSSMPIPDK